jgi:hypothetical protein
MILLECKNVSIFSILVVSNKRCYIQEVDDVTLAEYNVPILFDDGEDLEVYIDLSEYLQYLFKEYQVVKVFETYLDFGEVRYNFEQSDSVLQTSIPRLSCICKVPEISEEQVTLQVVDKHFIIKFGEVEYRVPTLYSKNSVQVTVDGYFLPSGLCKVFIAENAPIVFELDKKILYIAPIQ